MIPKYRARDQRGNWHIGLLTFMFGQYAIVNESDENTVYLIDKETIGQSTGFKDGNGVEIFEGDVANIHWFYTDYDPETLGAIENEATAEKVVITKEFGNLGFWWNSGDDWVDLATLALTVQLHEESFELLGNVHENPELLEVAE